MGSEGKFDSSPFAVCLSEAPKGPKAQCALNKSIDHSKIDDTVSIEIRRDIKMIEEKETRQNKKTKQGNMWP